MTGIRKWNVEPIMCDKQITYTWKSTPVETPQRQARSTSYSTKSMRRITQNYLMLAKLEHSDFVLNRSFTDPIRDIISPVWSQFIDSFNERNLICRIRGDGSQRLIWADKDLLKFVIENLLDNVVKYSEPKGKLVISVSERGQVDEFSVWNSGPGIENGDLERIFERFTRGRNLSPKEGAGIGLYLSRRVIEAHGGHIWAESKPGSWANIVFTIPKRGIAD
jgi:signal transduction histidine kinase